jgi:DNA-binding transcriptional MocR family regulator
MIGVKIDRDEPIELYEQVAAEIRRASADGEATAGERLPPARAQGYRLSEGSRSRRGSASAAISSKASRPTVEGPKGDLTVY